VVKWSRRSSSCLPAGLNVDLEVTIDTGTAHCPSTPTTRDLAASILAGYVAVIVAAFSAVAP
jgi:hypothetical protein